MSILIKGMKMPKSCDECRIMMFEDTNCLPELFCGCPIVFRAHPQGVGHRPDYCPLVEVPPHGRLIDADALKTYHGWYNEDKEHNVVQSHIQFVYANDIINAPTIIPAEDSET